MASKGYSATIKAETLKVRNTGSSILLKNNFAVQQVVRVET